MWFLHIPFNARCLQLHLLNSESERAVGSDQIVVPASIIDLNYQVVDATPCLTKFPKIKKQSALTLLNDAEPLFLPPNEQVLPLNNWDLQETTNSSNTATAPDLLRNFTDQSSEVEMASLAHSESTAVAPDGLLLGAQPHPKTDQSGPEATNIEKLNLLSTSQSSEV